MKREEALLLVKEHIKTPNLLKHALAVEACMKELAKKFGEDVELWGLAGLLHDLDYEYTKDKPEEHGLVSAKMLEGKVGPEIIEAIKAHADKSPRTTPLTKALYAIDPLTGLIVASALMHPQKNLKALDVQFVLNRFKEKGFARGANREQIKSCEELGLSLEEFVGLCLQGMKKISDQLGL